MFEEAVELTPRLRRFSIEIAATPRAIYGHWNPFEESPPFRPAVLRVKQIGPSHVLWEAVDELGRRRWWESTIAARVPGQCLAARNGAEPAGWLELSPQPCAKSRLELCVEYQPDHFLARIADAFGWIDAGLLRDLRRFGRCIECASRRRQL